MNSITRSLYIVAFVVAVMVAAGSLATPTTHATATFIVKSTGDAGDALPGDGNCLPFAGDCTLRAAIEEANALPGDDAIVFDIGAGGVQTILPATGLPIITDTVSVDGTTQPGFAGSPIIELSGASMTGQEEGLRVAADDVLIRGLVINNFVDGLGVSGIGIWILSGSGNVIAGNYIGTDVAGSAEMSNRTGVTIESNANVIGGLTAADRNVIAGNNSNIDLYGAGNLVQGNYLGISALGTASLGDFVGVVITGANNVIGGTVAAARNVISGNSDGGIGGVWLLGVGASGNFVLGNYIGVAPDGVTPVGNTDFGVLIWDGASNNFIGDTTGSGNVIAANGGGVMISNDSSVGNRVRGNSIRSNAFGVYDLLGIELFTENPVGTVTPNDVGDADVGPNNAQNFPTVGSALTNGIVTGVGGTFNSTPSSVFDIDVYSSAGCDVSGHGEGQTYLATFPVSTDSSGNGTWGGLISPIGVGQVITATATSSSGDTSEFSACKVVTTCVGGDGDCDGFNDAAPSAHQGPANTNVAVDNCTGLWNQPQQNADGNYLDLPGKPFDDLTRPNSDAQGDACDSDDDNDGRSDADEASGAGCGGIASDPLDADTDGDNFLDGAECVLGSNPAKMTVKPTEASCAPAGDTDGDKVSDRREVCYYNTDANNVNTDGDACNDGREVASINANNAVDVIDLQQVASEAGAYALPGSAVKVDYDMTKNGTIDVLDLQQVAAQSGACP
jgi:hypothetical protein